MQWMLILLAMGGAADPGVKGITSIGPYTEQAGCVAIGKFMEAKGWRWECVPTGQIKLKPKEEAPAEQKKPEKKPKP